VLSSRHVRAACRNLQTVEGTHKPQGKSCIWCGKRTDASEDGASFLFLAKIGDGFTTRPESWLDESPHAEGHQFFCHISCFRASIPASQQYLLELALDLP
jgi:hypothetical protein